MRTGPSISVVIPAYNAADFIAATVGSVTSQRIPPDQVVVVDDGSTDETPAILHDLARASAVPVSVIRLPESHGGPAHALNTGIEAARGDLIATLDHDDRLPPESLDDRASAYAACPDVGLVVGRVKGTGPDLDRVRLADRGWAAIERIPRDEVSPRVWRLSAADAYRAVLAHGCFAMSCSAFLFPKTTWRRVGGFDPAIRTACDYAFLRSVARRFDVAVVPSVVAEWSCPGTTLFAAAGRLRQIEDQWRVLRGFRDDALPPSLAREWREVATEFLFDGSYELRRAGRHRDAGRYLLRSLRWGGAKRQTLWALMKLALVASFRPAAPDAARPRLMAQ